MMRRRVLFLIALATLGGCLHRTSGVSASVWELRGAVVTITPQLLTVRHKTGQLVPLTIDDQTVFITGHQMASAAALTPGVRITIIVETSPQNVYRARQVEIFGRR
jgi:hypothetical protein